MRKFVLAAALVAALVLGGAGTASAAPVTTTTWTPPQGAAWTITARWIGGGSKLVTLDVYAADGQHCTATAPRSQGLVACSITSGAVGPWTFVVIGVAAANFYADF